MTVKNRPRFDIAAVRARAGEKTFARGDAYYGGGQVALLSIEPGRVVAQVAGSDDYRVELAGSDRAIGGACSCPAFEDSGFCKHMVAVALAANAAGDDAEGIGAIPRIRAHLKARGVDVLVEMILSIAERDPALLRRLDIAATAAGGDDKTVAARLRKAIDGATRTAGFVDYRAARQWAAGVDEALDALEELLPVGRAGLALILAERALDRLERAIEHIDDSDGYCGELLDRAKEIHLAAAGAAPPEPVPFARSLFRREMESGYGTFDGAAGSYGEILGKDGLAEYRRLASEAWKKLPPPQAGRRSGFEYSPDRHRLKAILDFFAERDDDLDARIALRAGDLSSPWNYLELAQLCLSNGRREEALRRAEEGLWMFEDGPPDERLLFFTVDLLADAGRSADAERYMWQAFEKAPSLALHGKLRQLGGEAAHQRAVTLLESRLAKEDGHGLYFPADLLIRVLMEEGRLGAAWAVVRTHGASPELKERLARTSDTAFPGEARETYAERVEQLVSIGGDAAYAKAVELVGCMAGLTGAAEHAIYVDQVRMRHARKRKLMKLLG